MKKVNQTLGQQLLMTYRVLLVSLLLGVFFMSIGCSHRKHTDHITNQGTSKVSNQSLNIGDIDQKDTSKLHSQLSPQQHARLCQLAHNIGLDSKTFNYGTFDYKIINTEINQQIALEDFQEIVNIAADLDSNFKIDDTQEINVTIDHINQTIVNKLDILIKINKYIHQDDPTDFNEGQIKRINKYRDYFASLKYDIESHDINFNIQKLQESRLIKESDIEKLQREGLIRAHKICVHFEHLVQKYCPKLEGNIGKGPLPPRFSWAREFNRVKLLWTMIGGSSFKPNFTDWNPKIIPNNSGYKVYRGCQPYEESHLFDLQQLGVKHIINLRRESTDDDYFKGRTEKYGITTYWIPMFDQYIPDEEQCRFFLSFISSKIKEKEGIYIHCQEGKGRTGLFSGMYAYKNVPSEYANQIRGISSHDQRKFLDSCVWKCSVYKL